MTAQVAEVKTTLGSVNQMLRAGNIVHFETGNCYIKDTRTGRRTKVEEKGGTFEVGIWVPAATGVNHHRGVEPTIRIGRTGVEPTIRIGRKTFHRQDEEF